MGHFQPGSDPLPQAFSEPARPPHRTDHIVSGKAVLAGLSHHLDPGFLEGGDHMSLISLVSLHTVPDALRALHACFQTEYRNEHTDAGDPCAGPGGVDAHVLSPLLPNPGRRRGKSMKHH